MGGLAHACHKTRKPLRRCAGDPPVRQVKMITAPQTQSSELRAEYRYGYIWAISLVAAMGGLLFGYDWVVIGGAEAFYKIFFQLDDKKDAVMVGWLMSCALVGCLIGSIASGSLSDRFGRKRLLLLSATLFTVSSIFTGLAQTTTAFVLWRIIGGIAIGMASNLSPMYIAEIAPAGMRGRLVAINQLTIVIGILAAQTVNWGISAYGCHVWGTPVAENYWNVHYGWPLMFKAVAIPSALFLLLATFVPESPRWLARNGNDDYARRVLSRVGGEAYAQAELQSIKETMRNEIQTVRFADLLERRMLVVLGIGVFLAVLQQWSGTNILFNYAQKVFTERGYKVSQTMLQIVISGSINLIFTLVAIAMVDRFGRRVLMLFGCASIAATQLLIGIGCQFELPGLFVMIFAMATIGCYALSLAPVTWVLISEIFPNRIRGAAVAVAVSALWIACFLLTFSFPVLSKVIGTGGAFCIYAIVCLTGFVFIYFRVAETKGKTLEQIEHELVDA